MKNQYKITRRKEIRECKKIANQYLEDNIERKAGKSKKWENLVVENNIRRLKLIIKELNHLDKDSSIEEYVYKEIQSSKDYKKGIQLLINNPATREFVNNEKIKLIKYKIHICSPKYSIENDLHWVPDGTFNDKLEISLGIKPITFYNQFIPSKILSTKEEVIPFLSEFSDFNSEANILKNVIKSLEVRQYSTANILIITLIEGIVRKTCKIIYAKQNPNLSSNQVEEYVYQNFSSLESLLTKGQFLPDYETSILNGYYLSHGIVSDELMSIEEEYWKIIKFINSPKGNAREIINEIHDILKNIPVDKVAFKSKLDAMGEMLKYGESDLHEKRIISIKPRLAFLLGTLKNDRNLIIHGKYAEFNKSWKSYLYLSAIDEIYKILKEYVA